MYSLYNQMFPMYYLTKFLINKQQMTSNPQLNSFEENLTFFIFLPELEVIIGLTQKQKRHRFFRNGICLWPKILAKILTILFNSVEYSFEFFREDCLKNDLTKNSCLLTLHFSYNILYINNTFYKWIFGLFL